MKREDAIKLIHEMRRYDNHKCTRLNNRSGFVIKQTLFPLITGAERRLCYRAADIRKKRETRIVSVRLENLKSDQRSLSIPRMVYQLQRHPIKKLPTVIMLPSGKFVLWDGNHRATAAAMLGRKILKCEQIRKARSQALRK